jgi:oxalate decarboxylase
VFRDKTVTTQGHSNVTFGPGPPTSGAARLWLGLFFALTAGWVDAIGFIQLGRFYLSFMSGNTTQLGVAIASSSDELMLRGASVIALFFLGAFFGTLLADASGRFRLTTILTLEAALFGAAIVLTMARPGFFALLPVAAAMGMQNTLRQLVGRANVGNSFVTGSLFSAAQSLARALTGAAPRAEWLAYLAAWIAFILGSAGGAYALYRSSLLANLFGIAAILAFLALLTAPASGSANNQDAEG